MDYKERITMDPSGFVLLSDYVPGIVQEIRYFSTYNFIGSRIDGYEEPVAFLTKEAARALKAVSNKAMVMGCRLKIFDAYRPAMAVRHFVLWGIEDLDLRMKTFFYPDLEGVYSWWSYRFRAREKNAGWRIDYFITSKSLDEKLAGAKIHTDVFGSDHCPVELDVDL